jgi:D-amino peptidase
MGLGRSGDYCFAAEQATREADAAAKALFDSGAAKVVIWDNRGNGANLRFDRLDRRCEIVLGTGFKWRFPFIDQSFAGVLMIGYHAMEGTPKAVLAHTYSHASYRSIHVNGIEVGEIAMDAAVAGEFGVPAIFLSSDDKGCKEGAGFMPWLETVTTKQGFGYNCAFSKHPVIVEEEIYAAVKRAVARVDTMKPFHFAKPITIDLCFQCPLQALKARIIRKKWNFRKHNTLRGRINNMLEWQC